MLSVLAAPGSRSSVPLLAHPALFLVLGSEVARGYYTAQNLT